MTLYDENIVQVVKDAADILEIVGETVNLKKNGINYKGLCPFHSEKTPSFTVNPNRNYFHCFGCGEGGDVLAFVMQSQNLTFIEALKYLADRYNITLPEKVLSAKEQEKARQKEILYEINRRAAKAYHEFLLNESGAAKARHYLEQRAIPAAIVEAFELGYAPESWDFIKRQLRDFDERDILAAGLVVPGQRGTYDRFRDRVLSPIFSHNGKHLGFSGRILGEGQPKYLNTQDSLIFNKSSVLLGLFQNKEAIRAAKKCLLVEGNFDLLALASQGIRHVAAPMGTAVTLQHVRSLKGYIEEAVLLFDGDQAGIKAAMRAAPLFLTARLAAKVVILPPEHDPDSFVRKYGSDGLEDKVAKASSLPEFIFNHLEKRHGLSLEGKGRIIEELKPIIGAIADDSLQRTLFVSHFSQKLGLLPEQLLGQFSEVRAPAQRSPSRVLRQVEKEGGAEETGRNFYLSRTERPLLAFLIIYPEYVMPFVGAGLDVAVTSPSGLKILEQLKAVAHDEHGTPERLMDLIDGPERAFVSEQLISAPSCTDEDLQREAGEKISWLAEHKLRQEMKLLTARINEAQRHNDHHLLMDLVRAKDEIHKKIQEK